MKKRSPSEGNRVSGFICAILGHHYKVSKEVTKHIKEYTCIYCNKQVTIDAEGTLSALTEEQQEINNELKLYYRKRRDNLGKKRNVA